MMSYRTSGKLRIDLTVRIVYEKNVQEKKEISRRSKELTAEKRKNETYKQYKERKKKIKNKVMVQ